MSLLFYGHPLSSYCQKALIALEELSVPFEWRLMSPETPENGAEFSRLWPIAHMPLLQDGDELIRESSVIIEHLGLRAGDHQLLPADPKAALPIRFLDRVFDNYVMAPQQAIVFESLRPPEKRDPHGVAQARARLDTAYAWLEDSLPATGWAAGADFSLADCAASPALFYASWTHPLRGRFPKVQSYLDRLEACPSIARIRAAAKPYWHLFPFAGEDRPA
ncbi:glutathione S-transferase [Pseudoroseomonas deserti]|uniref:Glutathione S-transferase n=1 Tax=Teichococcus deserti TaxID=1817963 RepID=A0A1V2H6N1_9PROT|nr:glutathione S-transferase family protein [Pseudoroseomonas deserti]ONG57911.1 glutathione S-transferase [Pseudoroseomonas deserti]